MMFLRYIDKKMTADKQKFQIKSFLFVGFPIGYSIVEILKLIVFGWAKYHFSISNCIFTFIFDVVLISPLIINYFLHKRKYKQFLNKIKDKKEFKVRALFDYRNFVKGQSYTCFFDQIFGKEKFTYFICNRPFITNHDYSEIELKDNINKFELDDIKEDRLKKLNKLNKQPWYKINKYKL